MNPTEAKSILLAYRPGSTDAEEPQVAEALALAKNDPELARWLEMQLASQAALQSKFKSIAPPPGLKEQIISEYNAGRRRNDRRQQWTAVVAIVVILIALGSMVMTWAPRLAPKNTLMKFQTEMVEFALHGYDMDFTTNDTIAIRQYLVQKGAPSDAGSPTALASVDKVGCAVVDWNGTKISLVCFRTGKPLPPNTKSDLWLFVADRSSVRKLPPANTRQITNIDGLITATWTSDSKVYLMALQGTEADLAKYF